MIKTSRTQFLDRKSSSRSNPIHRIRVVKVTSSNKTDICACCLSEERPFIPLKTCGHRWLLSTIRNFVINNRIKFVCLLCHSLLVKFCLFWKQVSENILKLNSQTLQLKPNRKVCNLKRSTSKTCPPALELDYKNVEFNGNRTETESHGSEATLTASEGSDCFSLPSRPPSPRVLSIFENTDKEIDDAASISVPETEFELIFNEIQHRESLNVRSDSKKLLRTSISIPETEFELKFNEIRQRQSEKFKNKVAKEANSEFEKSEFNQDSNSQEIELEWSNSIKELVSVDKNESSWNVSKIQIVRVETEKGYPPLQFNRDTSHKTEKCNSSDLKQSQGIILMNSAVSTDDIWNAINNEAEMLDKGHKTGDPDLLKETQQFYNQGHDYSNGKEAVMESEASFSVSETEFETIFNEIAMSEPDIKKMGESNYIELNNDLPLLEARREEIVEVIANCDGHPEIIQSPQWINRSQYTGKIAQVVLTLEELQQERETASLYPTYAKRKYKCESCIVGFTTRTAFTRHIRHKHSKIGQEVCSICNLNITKENLLKHYNKHFKRYECQLCGHRTKELDLAVNHYLESHGEVNGDRFYACMDCEYISKSASEYGKHQLSAHGTVQCDICLKTFAQWKSLKSHKRLKHNKKKIKRLTLKIFEEGLRWSSGKGAKSKRS